MQKVLLIAAALLLSKPTLACPLCNKQVRDAIQNTAFLPNLVTILSAFIAVTLVVAVLIALTNSNYKKRMASHTGTLVLTPVPLTTASMILGIGLGGFLDGIVFHQVLQLHEMLSNQIPATNYVGKSVNMFWDGIFHTFCLIVVLIGVILLWKLLQRNDIDRSGRLLGGGLLIGWSVFNIIEGIIDHQVLKLHNVVEFAKDHDLGNYAFLIASAVMLLIGFALTKHRKHKHIETLH